MSLGCIVIISLVVGIGFYLSPQDKLEPSDAIVAISGGETQQRVAEAVRLYQQSLAPLIIMSGAARDEGLSNAAAMKKLAAALDVPADKIIVEESAENTFENADKVKQIVTNLKLTKIILVTSPYHQRRASLVFHQALAGLPVEIINHSAKDSLWRKNGWWADAWAREITGSELKKILYILTVGSNLDSRKV